MRTLKLLITEYAYIAWLLAAFLWAVALGFALREPDLMVVLPTSFSILACAYLAWIHYAYVVDFWDLGPDGGGEPLPVPDMKGEVWDAKDVIKNVRNLNSRRTGT